jgi:hypothetical protein
MGSRRVAVIGVALLTVLVATAGLLVGCGSQGPHLPKVTTGVNVGPKPGALTIDIASSGDGDGVAQIVLKYPDGHSKVVGNGVLEDGTSLGFSTKHLPAGAYGYTVYAVPTATPPMSAAFPDSARTEKNVIQRGAFTID